MDYKHIWKVRWIQLLIVNVLVAALMIYTYFDGGPDHRTVNEALEYTLYWIIFSWLFASVVAAFTKNGSWISNTVGAVFSWGILGLAAGFSDSSSTAMAFVFAISMFKFLFGAVALIAVLCIAFVAYPFTTVYYLIKNLQTA